MTTTEPTVEPTTEPVVEPVVEPIVEPNKEPVKPTAEEKKFSQADVDKMIAARLGRAEKDASTKLLAEFGIESKDEFKQLMSDTRTLASELNNQKKDLQTKAIENVFATNKIEDSAVKDKYIKLANLETEGTMVERLTKTIGEFKGFGFKQIGASTTPQTTTVNKSKYTKF